MSRIDVLIHRTPQEKTRFAVMLVVSILAWIGLVVGTMGVGLIGALILASIVMAAQAALVAHLRGNGVRVGERQFPELHAKIGELASAMGMEKAPEAYVVQAGGLLNAMATRWAKRDFIVLYSDLLDACAAKDGDPHATDRAADMIIGHELAHLALGHLKWRIVILPGCLVPLLGSAYSRACEYSCDRIGLEAAGSLPDAARGLAVLAAGGRYGARVDVDAFLAQAADLGRYWPSLVELGSTHPYLVKRVAALVNAKEPGKVLVPSRNPLAYLMAPLSAAGAGRGGGSLIGVVVVIGILAAIAIPQFSKYRAASERGQQLALEQQMELQQRFAEEAARAAEADPALAAPEPVSSVAAPADVSSPASPY